MNKYLSLFVSFFKVGLFTFGGGYAMIPLIEKEMVEKKGLIDEDEMTDIVAVSESTPGPLAINCATFVGNKTGGILGAIISTLAVVLPSFLIILIISYFVDAFLANQYVKYAFNGIRVCVCLLICESGIKMFINSKKNIIFILIMIAALVVSILTEFNPAYLILIGGAIGLISGIIESKIRGKKNEDI